ncbi:MAG: sugar ABC transporter permease [Chloroflexi bacterium HGW-Chloroflexi-1]|nr:MAG: sugar ABC transporter permease [Chloroflexi bacterium HGW-Chloroflexi-1]
MAALASSGRTSRKLNLAPYLFLIVPLLLFLMWVIGPLFYSFYLSLTDWDGVSAPTFIGFRNYVRLFDDPIFYTSLLNNVKWLVSFITAPVIMGLALAMILNRDIPGARAIKAAFYSPYILSLVVVGLIFGWMYHPAGGLLNGTLQALGLKSLTPGWLSDPALATWCIIAAAIWRQVGYIMTLYLAGLQGVDPSLVDASRVDGANSWQAFRHVILPLLSPVTVVVVVVSVIDSLRSFDLVFVMTRGGPANASSVLANFMYIEAFNNYKMGYGAAIAVILFLISAVFIFIYLWRTLSTELEY